MDKGPCRQHNVRWFFDTTTRSCKEFIYGGCLGNYNNFETSERKKLVHSNIAFELKTGWCFVSGCVDYCVSDNQVPQGGLEKPRSSNNNNGQEEIIEERVPPPQSYPLPTSLLPGTHLFEIKIVIKPNNHFCRSLQTTDGHWRLFRRSFEILLRQRKTKMSIFQIHKL